MLEASINRDDFYRAPHPSPKVFNVYLDLVRDRLRINS